jgi:hypothetical protein
LSAKCHSRPTQRSKQHIKKDRQCGGPSLCWILSGVSRVDPANIALLSSAIAAAWQYRTMPVRRQNESRCKVRFRSFATEPTRACAKQCPLASDSDQIADMPQTTLWSSRPEEFHLQALPEPCVNLSIHTAPDVRPLAHAASGFASSTSSSCRQLASVGRWSRLNNAAPSVQLHYRAFVPNTSCSAPVLRIGTLVITVLAA